MQSSGLKEKDETLKIGSKRRVLWSYGSHVSRLFARSGKRPFLHQVQKVYSCHLGTSCRERGKFDK